MIDVQCGTKRTVLVNRRIEEEVGIESVSDVARHRNEDGLDRR